MGQDLILLLIESQINDWDILLLDKNNCYRMESHEVELVSHWKGVEID